MAARVQSGRKNSRPGNHASRSELHRDRRHAAANDLTAGYGRLAVDDATQQQHGVDVSNDPSNDLRLGQAEARRDRRASTDGNEGDRGASGESVSGHKPRRNSRRYTVA